MTELSKEGKKRLRAKQHKRLPERSQGRHRQALPKILGLARHEALAVMHDDATTLEALGFAVEIEGSKKRLIFVAQNTPDMELDAVTAIGMLRECADKFHHCGCDTSLRVHQTDVRLTVKWRG